MDLQKVNDLFKTAQRQADDLRLGAITITPEIMALVLSVDFCPKQYQAAYLTGSIIIPATEEEQRNRYFRWLCVGKAIREPEPPIKRTTKGTPTADELRMTEQADKFRNISIRDRDIVAMDIRKKMEVVLDDHIIIADTIDLEAEVKGQPTMLQFRTTRSVRNTFKPHRGDYGWGNWYLRDHTHAYFWQLMQLTATGRQWDFAYALYEYGPDKDEDLLIVPFTALNVKETEMKIRGTYQLLSEARADNYPAQGSYYRCKDCPVLHCESRVSVKPPKTMFT